MTSADHVQGADTFTLDFEYDAAGRLTSQNQDDFTLAHSYAVGSSSHYVQTTYSNGRTVKHNLDGRGRVTVITTTTQSVTTTQATNEYDDDNRLLSRTFGNGTSATWTYDAEDRVATIKHHCPSCGSGSSPWDFVDLTYTRDDEGNPLSCKHNHATATSELYAYDAADRLTEFKRGTLAGDGKSVTGTPGEAQRWDLDALGNWKDFEKDESGTKVLDETRTHRIDNALTAIGGTTLTYDPPGNLKDDGTYLYDYDCENRLTRVRLKSNSNVIGEYGYNALGWRVKKSISNSGALNGTFRLIYNSAWQLIEIRSVSGGTTTVAKQFIHAGAGVQSEPRGASPGSSPYVDDHVAMLSSSGGGWLTHYYHADGLFNTFAMSDGSAMISERTHFEPYGSATLTDSGGSAITMTAIGNIFERQGIARDWECGNDDNRRRWYRPTIGRWACRDPVNANGGAQVTFDRIRASGFFREFRDAVGVANAATLPCPPGPLTPTGPIIEHPETQLTFGSTARLPFAVHRLFEYLDSNPQSNVDPSGLFSIIDPFTGPSISSCCTPFSTTTTSTNVVDAGYTTRQSTETCECGMDACGRPRNGNRICTYHDHYIRFSTTTVTSTWYVKSSETRCNAVICPAPTTTTTHTIGPPEWGHSEFIACTPCVCP